MAKVEPDITYVPSGLSATPGEFPYRPHVLRDGSKWDGFEADVDAVSKRAWRSYSMFFGIPWIARHVWREAKRLYRLRQQVRQ